ncbi:hypothetical protein MRB53_041744 [Persea americana]|nr:hypothetical protein MRB53_041744 [Persea americana]
MLHLLYLIPSIHAFTQVGVTAYAYKTIDPIGSPGSYDTHLHMLGGGSVTAHTKTTEELLSGCTSTNNPSDLSAYWVPALLNKHTKAVIPPTRWGAYYLNIKGWRAIRLDILSRSPLQDRLTILDLFPELHSEDGTKTAYAPKSWTGHAHDCPEGMTSIPQLRFSIRYNIGDLVPSSDLMLSSGNEYSSHGDFIAGWTKEAAEEMLKATGDIHTKFKKHVKGDRKESCKAADREPEKGLNCFTGMGSGEAIDREPRCLGPKMFV